MEDIAWCARESVLDVVPRLAGMEGSAAEIVSCGGAVQEGAEPGACRLRFSSTQWAQMQVRRGRRSQPAGTSPACRPTSETAAPQGQR